MRKFTPLALPALAALLTGCPHNDYTVEVTPRGKVIERKLIFYRADGADSSGVPKYESFPSNELAAITALYPPGSITREGERFLANGEFSGAMPGDVGGAGTYTNFTTSLGSACFYLERFRGNDDLSAQVKKRLAAADQLTGLVIGWSGAEFGREPGYKNLRRFLDTNFRRDLKNLALYCWAGEVSPYSKAQAQEEFIVRFGQYLVERGYVKIADAPKLTRILLDKDDLQVSLLVQRFIAEKLGLAPSVPMPKSLAFLADPVALQNSWERFLSATGDYRIRLRQWEKEKKVKPDAKKPNPSDVAGELFITLVTPGSSGEDDHLTVRLALPSAPDHTNGKWDEKSKQVVWDSALETRESAARVPVFCYASWSIPDHRFQQEHFGREILGGDELLKYCLWRSGLDEAQAGEWEKLLSEFRPGGDVTNKLASFQFVAGPKQNSAAIDFGKDLIKGGLEQKR